MHTTSRPRLDDQQGFTLVEFMIAALIMSFVLGGTVMLATQMQQVYTSQLDDAGLEQEARYALDWIARDLRSATSDGYYEIDEDQELFIDPDGGADTNDSIRIQADINPPDGVLDDEGENITIAFDAVNQVITREDTNAIDPTPQEMTDPIFTDLQFTLLDRTRTATADPEQVAYVQVQVTAQSRGRNANTGEFTTATLATEVRLRPRR